MEFLGIYFDKIFDLFFAVWFNKCSHSKIQNYLIIRWKILIFTMWCFLNMSYAKDCVIVNLVLLVHLMEMMQIQTINNWLHLLWSYAFEQQCKGDENSESARDYWIFLVAWHEMSCLEMDKQGLLSIKEWSNRKVRIPLFDSQITVSSRLLVRTCIKTMHAKFLLIYCSTVENINVKCKTNILFQIITV